VNIGAPWPDLLEAEPRVLAMQTKLHQWAMAGPDRRFDDLFNLVYDPAFLVVAWDRVRGNRGARTAGVDGVKPNSVIFGAGAMLGRLRDDLKAGRFVPQRVRQKTIPKASGKVRSLGIPTAADRVVQASLKLVLEPIFEAGFKPCSYGFRPNRRAQDAIAEIHNLASPTRNYGWVFEADITACFDEIDHTALMGRVRGRVADKRVLGLVKAFLRAGVLTEEGLYRETVTGTPQGGILSPLLANIALSVLDEHFAAKWAGLGPSWARAKHRRAGGPAMRLVRYADDFVRHEALLNRVEMKRLHLWPVAAGHGSWGQPEPGDAGEGGKQPRQRRDGPALPDGSGSASKTRRRNESEPVAKPLNRRAGSNLVDMGRLAVHDHREVVDSEVGKSPRPRGHTECLRRRCGEAAGAQLDASLVDRLVVNVGTIPALPSPLPSQGGDGQARRRPSAPGWDGALVVVRGRESRPHGEGEQRVRSLKCGMPGGRR